MLKTKMANGERQRMDKRGYDDCDIDGIVGFAMLIIGAIMGLISILEYTGCINWFADFGPGGR